MVMMTDNKGIPESAEKLFSIEDLLSGLLSLIENEQEGDSPSKEAYFPMVLGAIQGSISGCKNQTIWTKISTSKMLEKIQRVALDSLHVEGVSPCPSILLLDSIVRKARETYYEAIILQKMYYIVLQAIEPILKHFSEKCKFIEKVDSSDFMESTIEPFLAISLLLSDFFDNHVFIRYRNSKAFIDIYNRFVVLALNLVHILPEGAIQHNVNHLSQFYILLAHLLNSSTYRKYLFRRDEEEITHIFKVLEYGFESFNKMVQSASLNAFISIFKHKYNLEEISKYATPIIHAESLLAQVVDFLLFGKLQLRSELGSLLELLAIFLDQHTPLILDNIASNFSGSMQEKVKDLFSCIGETKDESYTIKNNCGKNFALESLNRMGLDN